MRQPSDYTEQLQPWALVLRLDSKELKPHARPGGGMEYATDLRWYLATGLLPLYAQRRSTLKLINAAGEEIPIVRK